MALTEQLKRGAQARRARASGAGSGGSAATGSAAKRPPQEAGPAPGGLAPPAKRRRVENFQPPNSIPIDCTTKQTQDSQDCYGDDNVGLVSLEGMTALSSLVDPAEDDTAGREVTVSVTTKKTITGRTAWEFKIDIEGTNEGHAAGPRVEPSSAEWVETQVDSSATKGPSSAGSRLRWSGRPGTTGAI